MLYIYNSVFRMLVPQLIVTILLASIYDLLAIHESYYQLAVSV